MDCRKYAPKIIDVMEGLKRIRGDVKERKGQTGLWRRWTREKMFGNVFLPNMKTGY